MNWFLNMRIGVKLLVSYILIALIAGAMGVFSIYNIRTLDESDTQLFENMTVPLSQIGEISTHFQRSRVNVRDMIIAQDPLVIQDYVDRIGERRAATAELSASFETTILSDEMRDKFNEFVAARTAYGAALDKVIELAKQNRDAEALALVAEDGELGIAARAEQNIIEEIVAMKVEDAHEKAAANTAQATSVSTITMIVMGVVMALAIIIGFFVSSIITKPLRRAAYMIQEMSQGHFSERLQIKRKDEIGQMAQSMDYFADELQTKVIGVMNMISRGDVSAEIDVKDNRDELAPAMKKTVETIRELNGELQKLIVAATEGKLDVRADSSGYSGAWSGMITGINGLVDAFVAPINVTAEYVERISKGDIPEKITDTYLGDFNEIKNNLNNCIDAVNELVADAAMLSDAAVEGRLSTRADAGKHGGDFRRIVEGVNDTLDAVINPLNVAAEYVARISRGDIPEKITDSYNGDFNTIKDNLNTCIDAVNKLVADAAMLADAAVEGRLSTRADAEKHGGDFRKIVEGVNDTLDAVINPLNVAAEYVARISRGDIPEKITDSYNGDFNTIKSNLNTCIDAVGAMVADAGMLAQAAVEGRLSTRAEAAKHQGDFRKIVEGVNKTLDAVIEPIKEASEVLKYMSEGNLQVMMMGSYQGDHAAIKEALNSTLMSLGTYVTDISKILSEISSGNLDLSVTVDYKGDFSEIKDSLNQIISSLSLVMGDIGEAADQVASGSRQVSDGSQALSQGSTEQASSIQELTASIQEIASQTKQNAVNAGQASQLAATARESAEKGNNQMKGMLSSMAAINESSANISKIIKVIDDIAFQTNILALNAAVEAARAGQHGKGFAVVAEEVRNLAARSAAAARETTDLIEGSVQKVQDGTKIANETAVALEEIVSGVDKAATLVVGIAEASNEQASGIAQINKGIEQVSQVVQNNSATAEESAAASEELSSQAELLKDMVSRFHLRKGHGLSGGEVKMISSSSSRHKEESIPRIALSDNEYDKY